MCPAGAKRRGSFERRRGEIPPVGQRRAPPPRASSQWRRLLAASERRRVGRVSCRRWRPRPTGGLLGLQGHGHPFMAHAGPRADLLSASTTPASSLRRCARCYSVVCFFLDGDRPRRRWLALRHHLRPGTPILALTHWVCDGSRGARLSSEHVVRHRTQDSPLLYGLRRRLAPARRPMDLDALAVRPPEPAFDLPAGPVAARPALLGYGEERQVVSVDGEATGALPGTLLGARAMLPRPPSPASPLWPVKLSANPRSRLPAAWR
jgi:hypothetical protein